LGSKRVDFVWTPTERASNGATRTFSMYATRWCAYIRNGSWAVPDIPISGNIGLHLSDGIWYIACTSDDGDLYVIKPRAGGNLELVAGAVEELREEYPRNEAYE
jgi:hypothetical protein